MPLVTLIGYRGTGKSTVAGLIARRLESSWVDADAILEERIGCTIADLIRSRGEEVFRDAEAGILEDLLAGFDGVLSTGGGVILREANRRLIRERARPVVWLSAPVETIRQRLAADPATLARRPGLRGVDPLAEIESALEERGPLYRACADWEIDTAQLAPEEVAARIVDWLARGDRSTERGDSAS